MSLHNSESIIRSNLLFRLSLMARRWRQILDAEIQASGLTDAT
jgi:MarR family transcriptional regulator for hemolysin